MLGKIRLVKNIKKPKFSNQKDEYKLVWVLDIDGIGKHLLFTDREFQVAKNRAEKVLPKL